MIWPHYGLFVFLWREMIIYDLERLCSQLAVLISRAVSLTLWRLDSFLCWPVVLTGQKEERWLCSALLMASGALCRSRLHTTQQKKNVPIAGNMLSLAVGSIAYTHKKNTHSETCEGTCTHSSGRPPPPPYTPCMSHMQSHREAWWLVPRCQSLSGTVNTQMERQRVARLQIITVKKW